jgi:predicted HTH transcriptional regulator
MGMKIIIIFALGLVVGFIIVTKCMKRRSCGGIGEARHLHNDKQTELKEKRKAEIMRMFEKQEEVRNTEVKTLFAISDATATNYLSELEVERKVVQIGVTGRFVVYKKFNG